MLVSLTEVMQYAEKHGIAIGSFNAPNLESLLASLNAAEELNLPVIIQFAQCHESWLPLDIIGPIMVDRAKKAKVPVCVHLDHGETLEYLEKALKMGFTSIMFDGSTLPYEENLAQTKKAVALARSYHAEVEAELGSMGRRESGLGEGGEDNSTRSTPTPGRRENSCGKRAFRLWHAPSVPPTASISPSPGWISTW